MPVQAWLAASTGLDPGFTGPVALIESIIYVTKSDEDFERIYVQERKALF